VPLKYQFTAPAELSAETVIRPPPALRTKPAPERVLATAKPFERLKTSSAPAATVTAPVPSEPPVPPFPTSRMPPLTVVPPEYVWFDVITSVPNPSLTSPVEPVISADPAVPEKV